MKMRTNKIPPYEIGLCLAGAATGGAYSAGVMDFFLEAMHSWEQEKIKGTPGIPPWEVKLTEITGTSAGGITATLAVSAINTNHEPLPHYFKQGDKPPNNCLYATWVQEMTYENLFDTKDLEEKPKREQTVKSILNSNFMKETSQKVLLESSCNIRDSLPSWASHVGLSLTTTNLRGIPYSMNDIITDFDRERDFQLRKYADFSWYWATDHPSLVPEKAKNFLQVLDMRETRDSPTWKSAIASAQATAAVPLVFPTVQVKTPLSNYNERIPDVTPTWFAESDKIGGSEMYVYTSVDGAALNNRPYGLLRKNMIRDAEVEDQDHKKVSAIDRLPNTKDSRWSVIMVDPFPLTNLDCGPGGSGMQFPEVLAGLVRSVRGEATFHEDDVRAFFDKDNMEKFMIRPDRGANPGKTPLATECLYCFGGIIDEKIRLHDFMLGRLNCQTFLQKTFIMKNERARKHEIFGRYPDFIGPSYHNTEEGYIPVIPVVGEAARDLPVPKWPSWTDSERKKIAKEVVEASEKRFKELSEILFWEMGVYKETKPWDIYRKGLNVAAWIVRSCVVNNMLRKFGVMLEDEMKVFSKR